MTSTVTVQTEPYAAPDAVTTPVAKTHFQPAGKTDVARGAAPYARQDRDAGLVGASHTRVQQRPGGVHSHASNGPPSVDVKSPDG